MLHSTHLDDEQVQRFLHQEYTAQPGSLLRHLEVCGECRAGLTGAQREEDEVLALLAQADHAPPNIEVAVVVARARRRRVIWIRWAAGGLLAVGLAGAVAAGSPVRGWMSALAARSTRTPGPEVVPSAPVAAVSPIGGIAVVPGASFVVLFQDAQRVGEARVVVTDGTELVVRARSGAATFTSSSDRLVVDNRGSTADFDITIPSGAIRVEIRIGDRRVFVKDGTRITTVAPASGLYRIGLTRRIP